MRTRYIAELVGADGLVVTIAADTARPSMYAVHNVNTASGSWGEDLVSRAMHSASITLARVSVPLSDSRVASALCVAPMRWAGKVIGSLAAYRVEQEWESDAQRTLTRSADLIALELAETHARVWWQRSAAAWQRRIELLKKVRAELSSAPDPTSFLDTAASRVASLCGAVGVSVMLLDGDGELVVRSAFGPHAGAARSARRKLGEGISGWVAKHGEPLVLRGPVADPRFTGVDPTIEESLVVPLRVDDRVVGVLAARAARSADIHSSERLKDIDLVAGELSIRIARAQESAARMDMTERLENDRREAVAMYDLARLAGIGADPDGDLDGATDLIAEAFGHDCVAIWTLDRDLERLTCRAARGYGELLPGDLLLDDMSVRAVLSEQRPRLVDGAASTTLRSLHADSVILVPILVAEESAGLLIVGRRQRRYTQFDFSLAQTIADVLSSLVRRELAAQAVERAHAERRRTVAQLKADFADEMARVVYVLDACQRLLGRDRDLPNDLARAARDARSALDRLGIPVGAVAAEGQAVFADPGTTVAAIGDGVDPVPPRRPGRAD